jgi:hypothetical protein
LVISPHVLAPIQAFAPLPEVALMTTAEKIIYHQLVALDETGAIEPRCALRDRCISGGLAGELKHVDLPAKHVAYELVIARDPLPRQAGALRCRQALMVDGRAVSFQPALEVTGRPSRATVPDQEGNDECRNYDGSGSDLSAGRA